ncbi:hypothetical protein C8R45DRAFT_463492 [Mycena sanguinolenta]|nr:hypothetical protein C8R45DRAFT_463492 [Mycena sanguinolenta]
MAAATPTHREIARACCNLLLRGLLQFACEARPCTARCPCSLCIALALSSWVCVNNCHSFGHQKRKRTQYAWSSVLCRVRKHMPSARDGYGYVVWTECTTICVDSCICYRHRPSRRAQSPVLSFDIPCSADADLQYWIVLGFGFRAAEGIVESTVWYRKGAML